MTNQDMDFLARKIVSLENKHNALARARQLPNSSVRLIDGSDVSMQDSAESGSDNRSAIEQLEGTTTGIGSITDTEAENAVSVPEWFNELGVGVDVAWDSTQFATDLALQLETELGEAQLELEQALIDLDTALTESSEAKDAASAAVTAAGEAVDDAEAAITAARDAIVSTQKQWAVSSSATVAPTEGWSNTAPSWTAGQYIWERVVSTKGTGTSTTSSPVVITGNPGAPGDPGEPGDPGSPGATTYTWIKYSNSATGTAPVDDPTGMSYIGIAYNKLTPTESTIPGDYEWSKIKGDPGNKGDDGSDGVGVASTVVTYQGHSAGVMPAPTGSWAASPPAVAAGQYLWTRTVITYTNDSTSTAYSVARMGDNGSNGVDGRGITGTTVTYVSSGSGTTTPTSGWQSTIPVVAEDNFLWTRTVTAYTTGSDTISYSVAKQGAKGAKGDDGSQGTSVASVTPYYRLGTSLPAKPTTLTPTGWSTTEPAYVPGSTDNLYLTVRTVLSTNAFTYSDVSLDSAYAAGKAAHALAQTAQTTANGKNKVVRSTGNAASPGSYQLGDSWWKFSGSQIVAMWLHDGTNWVSQTLTDSVITNLDAGTITAGTVHADRIGALSISTEKLAAAAVTAGKIAAEAVTATHIAADSIASAHISAGAVVAESIAADSITTDKLNASAVTSEKIAASAIVAETIAAGAVISEHIAVDALDAMTIHSAQIYGGYIEAPVIASSDKLGSGANVLNDPGFTSTVDTAWVLSGHTGDTANRTQTDNITWDQTWQQQEWGYPGGFVNHGVRNWGGVTATATAVPNNHRETGTLMFSNISWVNTAARSLANVYTFVNKEWLQGVPAQGGGTADPTFRAAHGVPAALAGTSRTSYLTNSGTFAVVSGERWNARVSFFRIPANSVQYITGAWIEVINASSSAVLWSRKMTNEELTAGNVNDWWDASFTGNVKFRVKLTYTAGGSMNFVRRVQSGSYARRYTKGAMVDEWISNATSALPYQMPPTSVATGSYMSLPSNWSSRVFPFRLTTALFAKVNPEKGWRMTKDNGLELFNSLGAKTGQLDGQNNFLAGRFGTAESGVRWEMSGDQINLYNAANTAIASIKRDGSALALTSAAGVTLNGNPIYGRETLNNSLISVRSGYTLVSASVVREGKLVHGSVVVKRTNSTALESGQALATLPSGWRPAKQWEGSAALSGSGAFVGYGQIMVNGGLVTWSAPGANHTMSIVFTIITP